MPKRVMPLLLLLFVLASPVAAQGVEEIVAFEVRVEVDPGGAMTVLEEITVRALGDQIRRGIYRDIPTSFPRASGMGRIEAPFTVRSVTRNGVEEPYSLKAIGGPIGRGGMRIRVGNANVLLDHGLHVYEIRYETDRWVDFGTDETRLYWNVTGNGWGFPIRAASARIHVPELGVAPRLTSWTGPEGATTTTASSSWDGGTRIADFRTTETLAPGEGLTVSVAFPAGQLTPPTDAQQDRWFMLDWGGWIEAGYVVLLVIAVYLLMWRRVGVDPAAGPTRLRREPPVGYAPAELGYIEARGYHPRQLSAALISMAMKGAIRIHGDDSTWEIEKLDGSVELSPGEQVLFFQLLDGRTRIELKQSNHSELRGAIKGFRKTLARRLEKQYFENNRLWFVAGLAVSIVGFALLAWRWRFDIDPVAIFLGLWLTGWSAGVVTLVWRLVQAVRAARSGAGVVAWIGAGGLLLFSLPFIGAEIFVAGFLLTMVPSHLVLAAVAIGVTNVVFYHLLERPTMKGRGVLDELAGFRAYLGDDDDRGPEPGESELGLFERYLPFAVALGVEARWSGAFAGVLGSALTRGTIDHALPWYRHTGSRPMEPARFTSSLGSGLASSISAASSPPSSGGSSGGGSSGGGGGGGGGGGW